MRIDKEEKRSLKKLFVGILVMALLVTMVPFQTVGLTVMKAADTTKFDEEMFGKANTIEVNTTESLNAALSKVNPGEAIIIKFTEDIIYLPNEDGYESSLELPAGNIAFDLGAYDLYVNYISFQKAETISNIVFYGDENSKISGCDIGGNDQTINLWLEYGYSPNMQFNGEIDIKNMNFTIKPGVNCIAKGKDLSVAEENATRYYKEDEHNFVNYNNAMVVYEYIGDVYYNEEGTEKVFDISEFNPPESSETPESVFEQGAISKDVKIKYKDNYYENYNQEAVVVESNDLGLYHKTNVESEIIVDAIPQDWLSNTITVVQPITDDTAYLEISEDYLYCLMKDGYSKAIFNEGAIPTSGRYVYDEIQNDYYIEKIVIQKGEQDYSFSEGDFDIQLHFNIANDHINSETNLPIHIVNMTSAYVTASDNSSVWVPWFGVATNSKEEDEFVIGEIETENAEYIKSGQKIIITPSADMFVYQLQWGTDVLADSDYIEYYTNGGVSVMVPNFAIDTALQFEIGEIKNVLESSSYINLPTPYFEEMEESGNKRAYYGEEFTICGTDNYIICDADSATTNNNGWKDTGIKITDEGTYTKYFYLMDISMEENEIGMVPSKNYGDRYCLSYTYTLDTATPTITSVTANTKEDSITLKDGWQVSTVDTVWINEPSVTLEATAIAGDGLPVAGYKFGSASWQPENTYSISGEGVHDIEIHARDEFDVKLENAGKSARAEAGVWKASIGIDTTAPILLFTDANNSNLIELKSNGVYEGNLYFNFSESGSGLANFIVYEKDGEEWISNSENLVSTADGIYIKPVETDMTYRIQITDVAGNETIYDNILVKAPAQEVVPVPPEADPMPPTVEPIPPTVEPEQPADKPVPPTEEPGAPEDKPVPPVAVGNGRVSLISGTVYSLGEGTWKVSGDSTNYAGGITFYVSENGEYDFSQQ